MRRNGGRGCQCKGGNWAEPWELVALLICQEKCELIPTAVVAAVTVTQKQIIITFIINCGATDEH